MSDEQQPQGQPEPDAPAAPEAQAAPHAQPGAAAPAGTPEGWTPVAPPHPYATTAAGGRGLAISSMALGLVGLLTSFVSSLYFSAFVFAGAALGLVAIVLGIIALVKKQRPLGSSITGIASGAFAILTMVIVMALGFFALLGSTVGVFEGEGSGTTAPEPTETVEVAGWPANMATGGLLFGPGLTLVESEAPGLDTAPEPIEPDRASVADMRLYVDYRCPICSIFEQTNGELLEELVESGAATLEIVPLTFLDRVNAETYYSSRAAGAMACIADSQPEVAWQAHRMLLDPSVQPSESVADPSNDELLTVLQIASGGLSDEVSACISAERFVPFAAALSGWVFQNPVPFANDPSLMVQGTPTLVVNGEYFAGSPNDAAALQSFLKEQGL